MAILDVTVNDRRIIIKEDGVTVGGRRYVPIPYGGTPRVRRTQVAVYPCRVETYGDRVFIDGQEYGPDPYDTWWRRLRRFLFSLFAARQGWVPAEEWIRHGGGCGTTHKGCAPDCPKDNFQRGRRLGHRGRK